MRKQQQNQVGDDLEERKETKDLLVFSTSITKGINPGRFNAGYDFGRSRIQKWPGGRARHIKSYIESHLAEERPDVVILQVGGNDLPAGRTTEAIPIADIARDIMEMGLMAREFEVSDIFVAGIPTRSQSYVKKRCADLNDELEEQCRIHGFTFIDNSGIKDRHLVDGVHLTKEGSGLLADNYLSAVSMKLLTNHI